MTQQRRDNNSTEFGIWLRQQEEIDSRLGFTPTNIDYMWMNYKNNYWMLIEEKRYGKMPKFYQVEAYMLVDKASKTDEKYKGFHVLVFEKTSPDDGGIYLDGKFITTMDLLEFLQFKKDDNWYLSWFPKHNVVGISFSRSRLNAPLP
jgi:hypothetical protein